MDGFVFASVDGFHHTNHVPYIPYQGEIPLLDPGTAVAYLQLAVPNLRISKLLGTCVRGFTCDREPSLSLARIQPPDSKYTHTSHIYTHVHATAEAGGQVRSAYGWVLVDSPNGLTHQVIVGNRRDPAMMLALNVPNLKKAVAFYKDALGMREVPYPLSRCVIVAWRSVDRP